MLGCMLMCCFARALRTFVDAASLRTAGGYHLFRISFELTFVECPRLD